MEASVLRTSLDESLVVNLVYALLSQLQKREVDICVLSQFSDKCTKLYYCLYIHSCLQWRLLKKFSGGAIFLIMIKATHSVGTLS